MSDQIYKSTSRFTYLISNAVLGAFFFGYSVSYMNPAIHTADTQYEITGHPDPGQKDTYQNAINGLINAFPAIGAGIGAIISGKLAERFGIRASFILADMIGVLGYIFQIPVYLTTLLIGRLVIGFSVGMNSSLIPLYIKEFSPEDLSGPFGAMFQMTINIGCLVALILGMFFAEDGSSLGYFRCVLDFPMMICAFRIIFLAYIFRDDPPSFYLKRGKAKIARNIIKHYYKHKFVDQVYNDLKSEIETKQSENKGSSSDNTPSAKRRLYVGCILQIIQQFSGINAVLIYSSGLFIKITGGNNAAKNWLNIGVGLTNLVFSIVAIGILKNFGRRPLLFWGALACSAFLGLISLFSFFVPSDDADDYEVTTAAIMVIVFMYCYLAAFQLSLGPVVWIYDADVLSEKQMSIAVLCNWIGCAVVAQFFGLINAYGGMKLSFGIFFAFCSLGTAYIWQFVLETKDKTQNEIDHMFLLDKVDDTSDD